MKSTISTLHLFQRNLILKKLRKNDRCVGLCHEATMTWYGYKKNCHAIMKIRKKPMLVFLNDIEYLNDMYKLGQSNFFHLVSKAFSENIAIYTRNRQHDSFWPFWWIAFSIVICKIILRIQKLMACSINKQQWMKWFSSITQA